MTAPAINPAFAAHAQEFQAEGPQPLLREIPPSDPYPVAALGPLREAVGAVQGMTLAPVALPAASALAVASLAVQGHVDVETLAGVRPVSLFLLTIAASGERKSACDAPLMAGLRTFEREAGRARRDDMASWENAHALWRVERDRILGEARKAKGPKRTAAEADLSALGREPAAPPSADRTMTEPTFEGMCRLFTEGMPSLGIFSDEGGQFLGGHGMGNEHRQKTLAGLNQAWQGDPIRRTRQGEGSYTLFGRRLAMHLMVQPGVARAFMADAMTADIGFLPRTLVCEPVSTIGTRLQAHVRRDPSALPAFTLRLRAILDHPMPMDPETRELEPRVLPLSGEARVMLSRYADHVEAAQASGGAYSGVGGSASKSAEQAARLAGVLTAWHDLNAAEVTGETMADAITLASCYLNEAARLADAATVTAEVARAESLRKWLLTSWTEPELLPRDVLRRAPIRALRESPAARAAIGMLVKHGWLVALEEGTKVRGVTRKEAYRVVRESRDV